MRRVLVATVIVVSVGAVVAAAGLSGLTGPRKDAGKGARSDLPAATATVTRATLVDTQTEDGELGFGTSISVPAKLAGTFTTLPAVGATVQRGAALYRVDDTPVVLLYGSLPAYRALSPGTKGADVKQFEQNLAALGYKGFAVDDTYSASTAAAVQEWQHDRGLAKTGVVELGRVLYASGPVRVDALKAAVGDAAQPGQSVLTYTGSTRVITVNLKVSDQRLAKDGAAVTVTLPDGKKVPGTIARLTTVITKTVDDSGASGDPVTKIEVTITVADAAALSAFGKATAKVDFTASERQNVLTVPIAALLALAEGAYGLQVVDGAATRLVAVRTGLFAGGRVEVSGDGIAEGTAVGIPS